MIIRVKDAGQCRIVVYIKLLLGRCAISAEVFFTRPFHAKCRALAGPHSSGFMEHSSAMRLSARTLGLGKARPSWG